MTELPVGILSNIGIKTFLFTISAKGSEDTSIKRYIFEMIIRLTVVWEVYRLNCRMKHLLCLKSLMLWVIGI